MTALGCIFAFLLGCCVGSFINVVIYRLPAGISIIKPGSHCPACKHPIAWYDNIPLLSWLLLGRSCRHCGQAIPLIYPLVELATGAGFVVILLTYMISGLRVGIAPLLSGPGLDDWLILGLHLWLIAALIAASVIDFRLKVIPLSITSLTAALAVVLHGLVPHSLLPTVSPSTAGLAVGGSLGLLLSTVLLRIGILRPTFPQGIEKGLVARPRRKRPKHPSPKMARHTPKHPAQASDHASPRRETLHEILYLLPPIVLAVVGWGLFSSQTSVARGWANLLNNDHANALCASLFGLLIGGAVVWITRILGTLAFGREAMGLGDVHLMAAAGAVLGWLTPVLGFFIAPFYGLLAVVLSAARQHRGELPYGPWLSLGLLTAMVFQDSIWAYVQPGLHGFWQLLTG